MARKREHEDRLHELEQIIEQRQDWLFRFAYLRVGNREDAEDLVQDTLLRLFHSGRDLSHVESVERYLLRSISNACINYLRQHPPHFVDIEQAGGIAADGDIHQEYLHLNRLLDHNLPPEQAETVRLHLVDELTFRQVAKLQHLPEATVKSRYRYALEKLRQIIKPENLPT